MKLKPMLQICIGLMVSQASTISQPALSFDVHFNPVLTRPGAVVRALALQADGQLIVGGSFDAINGVPRRNLVRFDAQGALDPAFAPLLVRAWVNQVGMLPNSDIILAGNFAEFGVTQPSSSLLRLDRRGRVDLSFHARMVGAGPSTAEAMAIQTDGRILVGSYSALPKSYALRGAIARFNADGSIDSTFNPRDGFQNSSPAQALVSAIAIQRDGRIIVGGSFISYNGALRNSLARLEPDGTLDLSFSSRLGVQGIGDSAGSVKSVAIQDDGKLLIGGIFRRVDGLPRNGIARLNSNGTIDEAFNATLVAPGETDTCIVDRLAVDSQGRLLVMHHAFGPHIITRLNSDGTRDFTFQSVELPSWDPLFLVQPDGKILIGTDRVLRLEANGAVDRSFITQDLHVSAPVTAVLPQSDGKLVVAGWFTHVDGRERVRLVRFNTDGAADMTFVSQFEPLLPAEHLALDGQGRVLALASIGRRFGGQPDFQPLERILQRLNPNGSVDTTFRAAPEIECCAAFTGLGLQPDGRILISVWYNNPIQDGQMIESYEPLLRLNSDGSLDRSFRPERIAKTSTVRDLTVLRDGRIMAVINNSQVLRLNPDGSRDASFRTINSDSLISSFAVEPGGKVLVAADDDLRRYSSDGNFESTLAAGDLRIVKSSDGQVIYICQLETETGDYSFLRLNRSGVLERVLRIGGKFQVYSAIRLADGAEYVFAAEEEAGISTARGLARFKLGPVLRISDGIRTSRSATLAIGGEDGWNYALEESSDLIKWTLLAEMPSRGPVTTFLYDDSLRQRFYRVRLRSRPESP